MSSMTSKQTIEAVFAAFGRGDIPFILGKLSSDCRWTQPASVPWGGTHVGPDGVGKFFSILDAECTTTLWEVDEVVEAGEQSTPSVGTAPKAANRAIPASANGRFASPCATAG